MELERKSAQWSRKQNFGGSKVLSTHARADVHYSDNNCLTGCWRENEYTPTPLVPLSFAFCSKLTLQGQPTIRFPPTTACFVTVMKGDSSANQCNATYGGNGHGMSVDHIDRNHHRKLSDAARKGRSPGTGSTEYQGMQFLWNYDAAAGSLTIQCTDKPIFIPCSMIESRIRALVG